ncbi:type VI secretion system-associated FHA domain protein TagH [Paracoccus sulfuroxidans]|uniref:FHA domain protein n=1 Tax=Paracoccus sulfuroxidans TaxID=384678 RepID=A0A562NP25_9RHOB|nr:type VI secretion system-associated FHA domain protein TagH [Paracoccus sulfuroxidans]TWI33771.1 FHA domain protein [Paracoccus sulfuroxidans]
MTLTLQIENYRVLDDGGPVSIRVPERGLQAGRREGMGWVLPDASRHISGHHFDVTFDGGLWWLRDMSTNGTFLQGHRHRIDGAHALRNGDRFQVGQYIIVALLDAPEEPGFMPESLPEYSVGQPVHEPQFEDPWAISGERFEPVNPLPSGEVRRQQDFVSDFISFPEEAPLQPGPAPLQPPPVAADGHSPFAPPVPEAAAVTPPVAPPAATPAPEYQVFLQAFSQGAGLPPELLAATPPDALGRMLGETLRTVTLNLMAALQERSAARHFTRAGERTMRGATDNNPLKFLPDADQAMDAMFLQPRAGFLSGAAGFDEALKDLRRHQGALFAALQPALIELLEDLDPGQIETETKAGIAGNRKARAWENFVARWDAKTASENGILDEFIRLFAAAYRKADEQGR